MNDSMPPPTLGLNARKTAKTLGWLGVIPFIALTASSALGGPQWAEQALIAYGALILSFMAGTLWSDLIHATRTPRNANAHLLASNGLVLMAWPALWFPMAWASWWLAALFTAHLVLDAPWLPNNGPAWYRHMRLGISTVVITLLVLSGAVGLGIEFGLGNAG
ncbi:MAG TPA: DUF3429 domain-containing protein [Wenzhouxiangella sp.]